MNDKQITKKEIKSALIRSGYLLESRVAELLNRKGYFVESNIAFQDPETKKSREIDLFADYRGVHFYSKQKNVYISTYLIIELINNPQPIVFFINKSFNLNPLSEKMRFVTTPKYKAAQFHFVDQLHIEEFHHLETRDLCTQYCSFSKKKAADKKETNEWMASHPDALHDTFKKLLQFTDYKRNTLESGFLKNDATRFFLFQPLLVVQGDVFKAYGLQRSVNLKRSDMIQFEFNYHYHKEPSAIMIDVVTEKSFSSYLEIIESESKEIGLRIEKMIFEQ